MDNKRLIPLMVALMLIVLLWQPFVASLAHRLGYELPKPATQRAASSQPDVSSALPNPYASATPGATTVPGAGGWSVDVAPGDARTESIGSANPKDPAYAIELVVSNLGAGLDRAVLNDYKLSLRTGEPFIFQQPAAAPFAEQTRSLAVRSVTIDGTTVDLTNAKWTLVAADRDPAKPAQSLTYELPLSREGKPALVLRRTYSVFKRDAGTWEANGETAAPLGFEASVLTTFVNKGDRPFNVSIATNSTTVPPTEAERYADGTFLIGYARDGVVQPESHMVGAIRDPTDLLATAKDRTPYWFGAATSYFMALERFEPQPQGATPIDWFKSITTRTLTPDLHGAERRDEVVIATKEAAVAPGKEAEIAARVYLGPRRRETLTNAYYTVPWIRYDRALVIISGICGVCTWQWLIDILFTILKGFHAITRDWGLSIIGLVFLVRLALHPITKRAQLNMLKFGKLAPEMAKIKERHKDDQDAMNRAMMGFYKEHGSTQLMGCLPMFLQMPVWIALWQAMSSTFELRQAPFLYNLTWIHDLSKPDHLIDFANYGMQPIHIPFLSFVTISGINVLPFVYGLVQFIQFRIQPKPPAATPEQEQQQKMTQWMMLIFMPVLLYASPSGLMIYMITSFLIGIFESKSVKRQFEHMSANEARFEIIDPESPAAAKAVKATVKRKDGEPKKKGLFAMLEEAREKAAEMQREIEKNRKKGR